MKRVYLSTNCVYASRIGDIVRVMGEEGVKNIELTGGTRYYKNYIKDLLLLKERFDLEYSVHSYYPPPQKEFVINLASQRSGIVMKSINLIKGAIDLCGIIGCSHYAIHAGFLVEINPSDLSGHVKPSKVKDVRVKIDNFVNNYHKVSEYAIKNNVRLFLENNVYSAKNFRKFGINLPFMLITYDDYMRLKQKMDFNLLLDCGHLKVSCNSLGIDYQKELNRFFEDDIKYLHISENDGESDQHLPVKKDSLSYKMLGSMPKGVNMITVEIRARKIRDVVDSYNCAREAIQGGVTC